MFVLLGSFPWVPRAGWYKRRGVLAYINPPSHLPPCWTGKHSPQSVQSHIFLYKQYQTTVFSPLYDSPSSSEEDITKPRATMCTYVRAVYACKHEVWGRRIKGCTIAEAFQSGKLPADCAYHKSHGLKSTVIPRRCGRCERLDKSLERMKLKVQDCRAAFEKKWPAYDWSSLEKKGDDGNGCVEVAVDEVETLRLSEERESTQAPAPDTDSLSDSVNEPRASDSGSSTRSCSCSCGTVAELMPEGTEESPAGGKLVVREELTPDVAAEDQKKAPEEQVQPKEQTAAEPVAIRSPRVSRLAVPVRKSPPRRDVVPVVKAVSKLPQLGFAGK